MSPKRKVSSVQDTVYDEHGTAGASSSSAAASAPKKKMSIRPTVFIFYLILWSQKKSFIFQHFWKSKNVFCFQTSQESSHPLEPQAPTVPKSRQGGKRPSRMEKRPSTINGSAAQEVAASSKKNFGKQKSRQSLMVPGAAAPPRSKSPMPGDNEPSASSTNPKPKAKKKKAKPRPRSRAMSMMPQKRDPSEEPTKRKRNQSLLKSSTVASITLTCTSPLQEGDEEEDSDSNISCITCSAMGESVADEPLFSKTDTTHEKTDRRLSFAVQEKGIIIFQKIHIWIFFRFFSILLIVVHLSRFLYSKSIFLFGILGGTAIDNSWRAKHQSTHGTKKEKRLRKISSFDRIWWHDSKEITTWWTTCFWKEDEPYWATQAESKKGKIKNFAFSKNNIFEVQNIEFVPQFFYFVRIFLFFMFFLPK